MSPILRPYDPADADWVVARHAALYARDEGFDESFAGVVRAILQDFSATQRAESETAREAGWIALDDASAVRLGSVFVVQDDADWARLRLFLIEPESRGTGLAQRMMDTALAFARGAGYRHMRLWTHESHAAAGRLYARNGFSQVESVAKRSFGQAVVAQTWARAL